MGVMIFQPGPTEGKDTFVHETSPPGMVVVPGTNGTIDLGHHADRDRQRLLLEMDLSAALLSNFGSLTAAQLDLFEMLEPASRPVDVLRVTQAGDNRWIEAQATWANRRTTQAWTTPGGDFDGAVVDAGGAFGAVGWNGFDVLTTAADALSNRAGLWSVGLRYQTEDGGAGDPLTRVIASDYIADASLRPRLTLTFDDAEVEPAEEPLYQIMRAQARNIQRIATGLLLNGTTAAGGPLVLHGPRPNVIRLYDKPMRMIEGGAKENWERIVTITPVADSSGARFAARNDRTFAYMVMFLLRLTEAEKAADHDDVLSDGLVTVNRLARKCHRTIYDWHLIFHDALHLLTDDCPQGLVDDASYSLRWDVSVDYPQAMFVAEVRGTRSAW